MKLTIAQAVKVIKAGYKIHVKGIGTIPILLNGPTGLGKTASIKKLGDELGLKVIDLKLGFIPEVLGFGIPREKDGSFELIPIEQIKIAVQEPVILFLDEITLASNFNLALSLIFGRELLGYNLHPQTFVVSACNYGANYDTNTLPDAVRGRFAIFNLTYATENVDYLVDKYGNARLAGIKEKIVSEMTENDANVEITPLLNPRTLEYLCWVEKAFNARVIDSEEYNLLITGILPANLLKDYLSVPPEVIWVEQVIKGEKPDIAPDKVAQFLTYVENIFTTLEVDAKIKILSFVAEFEGDMIVGTLQKLIKEMKTGEKIEFMKTPAFQKVKLIVSKYIS